MVPASVEIALTSPLVIAVLSAVRAVCRPVRTVANVFSSVVKYPVASDCCIALKSSSVLSRATRWLTIWAGVGGVWVVVLCALASMDVKVMSAVPKRIRFCKGKLLKCDVVVLDDFFRSRVYKQPMADRLNLRNMELFQGDIALISGANKGIGYEIARGLGAKKITVLVGARDAARGDAAVAKLKAEGVDARFVKLDVTDRETIRSATQWIEKEFGRLDILVNNAGISGTTDFSEKPSGVDLAKVREVYETNLFGPIAMTQALLPLLRKSKHGRIVNVSSGLGSLTLATQPDSPTAQMAILGYNTSKTALNSMTVQFANELKDTPIKVNAICPGYCATDLNGNSGPRTAAQGAVAAIEYATIGEDGPTGGYFNDEGRMPW
jgi:NAD(P)-dependent dehydrogenase (short-subunit alcohol dehydrogenase family)